MKNVSWNTGRPRRMLGMVVGGRSIRLLKKAIGRVPPGVTLDRKWKEDPSKTWDPHTGLFLVRRVE